MPKKRKLWSYSTGERGRNRVRVSTDPRTGILRWSWTGREVPLSMGHRDRDKAKTQADALAARLGTMEVVTPQKLTLSRLLALYLQEVTPSKGPSKQEHDRRAAALFRAAFSDEMEPKHLDRRHWDAFIQARRRGGLEVVDEETGKVARYGPVRDRVIQYDLKFMVSVLGWAVGVLEKGQPLLERNPWGQEIRRAQSWTMPKEATPRRPGMSDEVRAGLIAHSPNWRFSLALVLGRYTVSRNSSVRHLRWPDIDLRTGTVKWRGEYDKAGREVVTALLPEAVEALRTAPRGIGDAWVFPSETAPSQPTSRDSFQTWLRRAKAALLKVTPEGERPALREQLRGLGFHAEKRAGVRDPWFRGLDPKMKETLSRTDHRTLVAVYDAVEVEEMREAIQQRRKA